MILIKKLRLNTRIAFAVIAIAFVASILILHNTKVAIKQAQQYILVVNKDGMITPCVKDENRK